MSAVWALISRLVGLWGGLERVLAPFLPNLPSTASLPRCQAFQPSSHKASDDLNTEDFCHGLLSCAKSYSTVLNVDPPEPQSKRRWIGIRKVTTTPRSAMMEDEYRVEVERLDVEDAVCGLCRSPVNPGAIVCAKCGAHKEERFGFRGGLARSRLLTSLVAGAVSLPLMFISRSESRVFLVFLVFFLMCLISAWRAAAKIKKIPARTYWVKRS